MAHHQQADRPGKQAIGVPITEIPSPLSSSATGGSPMRSRLLPETPPRRYETSDVPQKLTSTSLATSRPRKSRLHLNASNQTRQWESTRSTRSSSYTRARSSSNTRVWSSSYIRARSSFYTRAQSSSYTRARSSSYTRARSSSFTRATKPTNGSESSSPSVSAHPRSQKSGAGPRSSHFQSQTSRWTILKGTSPYRFSASLTSSWNASSTHASTW